MVGPRVAIVGAGPAGAFAAAALLRSRGDIEIDLLERLPTPWGLLRGGVAPDHQEIKRLEDTFDRLTLRRGCRFLGNVEVGVDISHSDLMRHYTAVIYAIGAQTDKSLGIPGEDLPGSWAATELVAWYNGHPDYRGLEFDLSAKRAVVIGNGNVAADVTRMLALSPQELERTDVADHALEALRESRVEEIVVLGRRGPAQAAFTSAELRELGRVDGADVRVDPSEVELDPVSRRWLVEDGTFTARKNVELLRGFAAQPAPDARRRSFVLPNERGRVLAADGEPLTGVYAVGWIKRGPTGILGTNKRDAEQTVGCLVEDLRAGMLPEPPRPGREQIDALLAERCPELVTVDGWRAIDAYELERGRDEQRPRVKLASREELLAAAGRGGR
jgi:ferredoxin--NADP+ reductase